MKRLFVFNVSLTVLVALGFSACGGKTDNVEKPWTGREQSEARNLGARNSREDLGAKGTSTKEVVAFEKFETERLQAEIDFRSIALQVISKLQTAEREMVSEKKSTVEFEKLVRGSIIDGAKSSGSKVTVVFPKKKQILLNVAVWNELAEKKLKEKKVIHSYFELAGIEKTSETELSEKLAKDLANVEAAKIEGSLQEKANDDLDDAVDTLEQLTEENDADSETVEFLKARNRESLEKAKEVFADDSKSECSVLASPASCRLQLTQKRMKAIRKMTITLEEQILKENKKK